MAKLCVSFVAILLTVITASALSVGSRGSNNDNTIWSTMIQPAQSYFGYPAVYNDAIYIAAQGMQSDTTIFALGRYNGSVLWHHTTPNSTGLYVAAGDGLVFSGTSTSLDAWDAITGNLRWSFSPPAGAHSSKLDGWPGKPTYLGNGIVACTWYNTGVYVINATSGNMKFNTTYIGGSRIWTNSKGDRLYFMQQDPSTKVYSVTAANATDGSVMWTFPFNPQYDTCVANDYGLVVRDIPSANSSQTKLLWSFNPETGEHLWTHVARDSVSTGGFDYNIDLSHVIVTYQNSSSAFALIAYDLKTGNKAWAVDVPTTDNTNNLGAGSTAVFVIGYTTGKLFAYDSIDGQFLWSYDTTEPFYGTAVDNVYYWGSGASGTSMVTAARIRPAG